MSPPEAQRNIIEAATQAIIRESQIAYHGLAAFIAQERMEYASKAMERMDHKEALYHDLGNLALTGRRTESPTASGQPAMPRTIVEKFVDWRMDRKAAKRIYANNEAYIDRATFGPDRSDFGTSVRQAVVDRALSVPFRDRDVEEGVLSSVAHNAKAVLVGPDLEKGTTPLKKGIERTKNNALFLGGRKTAAERRKDKLNITATSPKYGNKSYKRTRRAKRRADERLDHMTEMPITSRWRQIRQKRAVNNIIKQHHRNEEHREAIRQLRENAIENGQPTEVTDAEIIELAHRSGLSQTEAERHLESFNNIEESELEDTLALHPEDMDQTLESLGFMISNGNREQRLAAVRNIVNVHNSIDQASRVNRKLIKNFITDDLGYDNASGQSLEDYLTSAVDYGRD